ncbi:MAG: gamma-glutamyltransferase, partial [Thermoanaerobaculia bacterium]|nr:gamma-glutamyltransferase [Thermoanaerobaculia bacterium]
MFNVGSRSNRYRRLILASTACLLAACAPDGPLDSNPGVAPEPSSFAAMAIPDVFAADAAEAVLRDGGNAVDAGIATAFVLAVTFPEAGNLGGGGFLLSRMNGESAFLDYRETAPAAASRDMYLDDSGDVIPNLSLVGHLASGVPGTVAGLWAAHQRYGTLPWARLVQPAIGLAENGFLPPARLLEKISRETTDLAETNFSETFGGLSATELFRQPELAATLQRIADNGRDGFYHGPTAEMLVAEMTRGDGIVSAADLAAYEPKWREPLTSEWQGFEVLSAPPPSSGGFAVIQLLEMKESLAEDFADLEHNSGQYVHLIAEMEKRVFADRAEYLGDSDVVDVPIDELIDEAYIHRRAQEVNRTAISAPEQSVPGLEESPQTTHFSIIDFQGNAVSNTYTLNGTFGNGVVVEGAGFLLNNEMDDFSAKPGVPNLYGVVGAEANSIAPGKRMLSSMSPTILLKDGEIAMVLGTPGGSTIFTSVFQTILNIVDFGMTPSEAVSVTRFHHQLLPPDLVTYSPGRPLPEATVEDLEGRGYR